MLLQALGRKRVIALFALAILNGLTAYAYYSYFEPQRLESDKQLSVARSDLETKREEIKKLKLEYVLLQSQLRSYKELEAKGFFNDQNRVKAQESFEKLRNISGVLKAKYDIQAGIRVEDAKAKEANYVVLKSPVTVELDSLDDGDIYSFVKLIQERFPGKVDIATINVTKNEKMTSGILRKIGSGEPVTMVKSKIEFDWRTMAPLATIDPSAVVVDSTGATAPAGDATATPPAQKAP